jgi:KDO2-lipid IV(A) lauroyltransferase
MRMLYQISAFISFFMFYIFPYRKNTVMLNLSRSFPEKNEKEINLIMRDFYRLLTDNVAEIIKSFSISAIEQAKKVSVTGMELIENQLLNNKHVIICMGHCGNWEILNILSQQAPANMYAVYKPLRNNVVDRLFLILRSRFGMRPVQTKSVVRHILTNKKNPSIYLFVADQCPKQVEEKYRVMMLNQKTSMFSGVEKLARSTNAAVMYMHVTRKDRGKYEIAYKPICIESKNTDETEIIKQYSVFLEQNIRERPSDWLWTHKRWKR